jgi:hypothetical protein
MLLLVEVSVEGQERPPVGSPVHLEVRDTSLADVESPLVTESMAEVGTTQSRWLQNVELEIPESELSSKRHLTVFVHVDVDQDGVLSAGDYITTRSYEIPYGVAADETRLQVTVKRI